MSYDERFNVGDRVKILLPAWKGKEGTVTKVLDWCPYEPPYEDFQYRVVSDEGNPCSVMAHELELQRT